MRDLPLCTPESIAAAKLAQRLERDLVYAETGVRIDDEGHFVFPPQELSDAALLMQEREILLGLTLGAAMSQLVRAR